MSTIFNRKTEAIVNEVKNQMLESLQESAITQESLADDCQVTQATISRWFSYKIEYFPPLYILSLLPEAIAVPLCKFFLSRFNKIVIDAPKALKLDGDINDNLLAIDVFQAEIIKDKGRNPKKVIAMCEKMERELATIKQEALQSIATSSTPR